MRKNDSNALDFSTCWRSIVSPVLLGAYLLGLVIVIGRRIGHGAP